MLSEIRIRGLGVIDDAELTLGSGLTVVTGETGAGKTMVLSGLQLLRGGRADPGAVRRGAQRAVVEGRLRVPPGHEAAERAREADADLDDDELLVSRTVLAEGRSRAHVGGRSAPVGLLAELADSLIAVHGQSDQQRLLKPERQRLALDTFAGASVADVLSTYEQTYQRWRAVERELAEVTTRYRERAQEADMLRIGLEEIEKVDPQPGEDVELLAEEQRLGHAEGLKSAAATAHELLTADDPRPEQPDAMAILASARHAVDAEREHDPALDALAARLAEVAYLLGDVAADLASYAAGIDTDPERLAAVQDRRAAISQLVRKYGDDIPGVLAWAEAGSRRLLELDGDDDRVVALGAERDELHERLTTLAAELTAARAEAAERLSTAVGAELAALAMPHARVIVKISPRHGGELGPNGADAIEILFSAHADAQPRPLDKGASGGELSRLMLAIEVVLAGTDPVPTFVFDEVDAGVGGKAAVEVGRRLARLARSAQVLVVTHLPQVAAFADHHLVVVKSDDGRVTSSDVTAVDEADRVRELSRMLAGMEDSTTAMAHAEELLATASAAKAQVGGRPNDPDRQHA